MNVERLTERNAREEHAYYPRCFDECDGLGCEKPFCDHNILVCDRLAAYEDTGLSPADIADLRNELCLKCGRYKTAHEGSCDGCRWKGAQTQ